MAEKNPQEIPAEPAEKVDLPPDLTGRQTFKKITANNKTKFIYSTSRIGAAALILISLAFGFLGGWLGAASHGTTITNGIVTSNKQTVITSTSQDIAAIAKDVGQSVVSVNVTAQQPVSSNSIFGFGFSFPTQQNTTVQDAGSGIIISADGLILTNRHVIPSGTTSVSVTLSNGTVFNNVKVVGRTSSSDSLDIALLKIQNLNGQKLVPAVIGNSANMKVGDQVVAIGNALGQFQNSVTNGIISGYGRSVQASDGSSSSTETLEDVFQTDAAINPGNSGGPLVNMSGQVIGINTAIASNAQNIGFAIPINDVVGIIKNFEQTGKFQRPYLGVVYIPVTPDVAQEYNLGTNNGAWIPPSSVSGQAGIVAGSPAASAGLQEGDIITAVNGTPINQANSLTALLDQTSVGQQVQLQVLRNGKTITIQATIGSAPVSVGG